MSTIVTRSLTKKHVIILLLMISLIAIPLKLYTVEFSLPVQFDNLGYALDSMQYSEGDFFVPPKKNPGWPLFAQSRTAATAAGTRRGEALSRRA